MLKHADSRAHTQICFSSVSRWFKWGGCVLISMLSAFTHDLCATFCLWVSGCLTLCRNVVRTELQRFFSLPFVFHRTGCFWCAIAQSQGRAAESLCVSFSHLVYTRRRKGGRGACVRRREGNPWLPRFSSLSETECRVQWSIKPSWSSQSQHSLKVADRTVWREGDIFFKKNTWSLHLDLRA